MSKLPSEVRMEQNRAKFSEEERQQVYDSCHKTKEKTGGVLPPIYCHACKGCLLGSIVGMLS